MPDTTIQPPTPKSATPRVGPRPRRTFWWRLSNTFRNQLRDALSRDQLMTSLKSLAWVVPMTILIWVYAEREQTNKSLVQFHLVPQNNDPTRLVELQGPDGQKGNSFIVRAELSGRQTKLDEVRQKLEAGGLPIDIADLPPGRTPMAAASLLANHPEFVKEGLTISNIVPSPIFVVIDKIEHRKIPVIPRPPVSNLIVGAPVFNPSTIVITGPKSVLGGVDNLVALAELPTLTDPGPQSLTNVRISIPINNPNVTISQATVSADVTVKKSDVETVVDGVPVWAAYPPLPFWNRYRAEFDKTLGQIKVSGPPDIIHQIADQEIKPKAWLDLNTDKFPLGPDALNANHTAIIHYELGDPRLKVAPDAPHELTYKIVERN